MHSPKVSGPGVLGSSSAKVVLGRVPPGIVKTSSAKVMFVRLEPPAPPALQILPVTLTLTARVAPLSMRDVVQFFVTVSPPTTSGGSQVACAVLLSVVPLPSASELADTLTVSWKFWLLRTEVMVA